MSAKVLIPHYDALEKAVQNCGQVLNMDAGESIFFARELERILPEIVEDEYPELKSRTHFPIDATAHPADTSVTWRRWTALGQAKIISDMANDLPEVEISADENTTPIRSIGISFGYSVQDIRASQKTGRSLDSEKGRLAREAAMRLQDEIAYDGDSTFGLPGFLTNANITEVTLANDGTGSSKLFANKTADQIVRDLSAIAWGVFNSTKGRMQADSMLFSYTLWGKLNTMRIPDTNMTVMQFFRNANPQITFVDYSHRLETAGAGNATMTVAYKRTPDVLKMILPVDYETFPVQVKGFRFTVPGHMRFGGVIIKRPLGIAFADGA